MAQPTSLVQPWCGQELVWSVVWPGASCGGTPLVWSVVWQGASCGGTPLARGSSVLAPGPLYGDTAPQPILARGAWLGSYQLLQLP